MIINKNILRQSICKNVILKKKNYKSFFLSMSTVNKNLMPFYDGAHKFIYPTTTSFHQRLIIFNNFLCDGYFTIKFDIQKQNFYKIINYLNLAIKKPSKVYILNKTKYLNFCNNKQKTNINLFIFNNKIKYNLLFNLLLKTAIGINFG
jgi:hypothetical protein